MRWLFIGFLGLAWAGLAQQTATVQKPAIIEGRVMDAATGAPLRKTTLTLRPLGAANIPGQQVVVDASGNQLGRAQRQYTAVTDGEGRYSFSVDQAGSYRVAADHNGYVRGEYGARRPGASGQTVTVTAGQRVAGIDVKMTPHGVIAGRVVDEDGDAVERAQVTVTARLTANGASRSSTVITNDLGEFRAAGLTAGKYYLMANRIGVALSDNDAETSTTGQETYAVTYFPGVTDSSSAAAIAVGAGQQVTGVFIPMRKARVFKVTGVISGSVGEEETSAAQAAPNAGNNSGGNGGRQQNQRARGANRVVVNLVDRNEGNPRGLRRTLNGRVMNPDGSFEITNVPTGSYWAMAISPLRGAVVVGRAAVDVRNGNVAGVVVPVAPPVTITGITKAEGREAVSVANARILLNPMGDQVSAASGQVQANGSFQIPSASRARFRVSAQGLADGVYLKSVRVNGQEAPQANLDLTSAPAAMTVELAFSGKAASITGTVKLSKDSLPGRALLVADPYSDSDPAAPPVGTPIAVSDTGTFTIKNVPPGTYRVYAFEDVDFQSVDAAMLKRLEARSTKLSLNESATATIETQQITAEESSPDQ